MTKIYGWDCKRLDHIWLRGQCTCAACGKPYCKENIATCSHKEECMKYFWYNLLENAR